MKAEVNWKKKKFLFIFCMFSLCGLLQMDYVVNPYDHLPYMCYHNKSQIDFRNAAQNP